MRPPDSSSSLGVPEAPTAGDDSIHRDKLSVMGHMASSVAHELNNPLATIAASAQAILAFWPDLDDDADGHPTPARQLREDLELILHEARRAGEITANLLAFARNQPAEHHPTDLCAIVRRTEALCRHHLDQHHIALTVREESAPPQSCRVRGDANQLQQVLLNLVVNAQQALSAFRGSGQVWIGLEPTEGGRVAIVVDDDGPGVPSNLHRTIFKPYYTTKSVEAGTGLGLSISASIIANHGGELCVSDREPTGARFVVTLPLASEDDEAPLIGADPIEAVFEIAASPNDRGRILLVDDEPGIRKSVGKFLRRFGYVVETATTGVDAVEALAHTTFDVIISDLRMPDLSGEELFDFVQREIPEMAERIIFMSGDMMRKETRAFLRRTGCPTLQKPYELSDLVRMLAELRPTPEPRDAAAAHGTGRTA